MSIYPSDAVSRYRNVQRQTSSYGVSSACSQGNSANYFQNFNSRNQCDTFESPTTQLIAPDQSARMWGDPHIDEADSGKYDFNERGVFNLLEDQGVTLNARLDGKEGEPTYIKKSGLVVNDRKICIGPDGNVKIKEGENGQDVELQDGETRQLGNGSYITKTGDTIQVGTPEYKMEFKTKQGNADDPYMDVKILTRDGGVALDGKKPTGLLGETFDQDKTAQTKPNESADYYKRNKLFEANHQSAYSGQMHNNPESQYQDDSFKSPNCEGMESEPQSSPYGQDTCNNGPNSSAPQNCGSGNGGLSQAEAQGIMKKLQCLLQQLQQYFNSSSANQSAPDNAQEFS